MTSKWTIIAKVVTVQPEKINLLGICWPSDNNYDCYTAIRQLL